MTTRYFDWDGGSDSNDGLTTSTPWKSYDAKRASIAAGDRILVKRGTTQTISTQFMDARAGNPGAPTVYGAYGVAQVPYAFWQNPTANGNMILNASAKSHIAFEDMYFDGLGVCTYSLYMFASGSTACGNHRISRCYFTNMASGQAGLAIGGTTATGVVSNFLIEDSYFFSNPGHGLIIAGTGNALVRRCKFSGNGFDALFGAHGFSSRFSRTDATSGWTNTSGTVWQRTLAAYETNVYYVKTSVSPYQRLNLTTGTQTAPAAGEFGVSGGVLYINLNSATNPATQGVNYAWGRCYNIIVEDCESYGNIADPRSPSTEGHGFAFDDYTELSIFRRNLSRDNQGAGFSVNRGDGNVVESNIAYGNGLSGVVGAACKGAVLKQNTLFGNNIGTSPHNGELVFFTYAKDAVISNNALQGATVRALDLDATCTGFSGTKNAAYGYSTIESGSTLTGTITDAPLLTASRRPQAAALLGAGTPLGGRDFYGRPFHPTAPNIGAVGNAITRTSVARVSK